MSGDGKTYENEKFYIGLHTETEKGSRWDLSNGHPGRVRDILNPLVKEKNTVDADYFLAAANPSCVFVFVLGNATVEKYWEENLLQKLTYTEKVPLAKSETYGMNKKAGTSGK